MSANIDFILNEISSVCSVCNRNKNEIFLLPVSKTKSLEQMEEVLKLGYFVFGENKVQEILQKYDYFKEKVKFHMIGHLQTNKVKYIIDKVELIHSLDRISLLDKLNLEAKKRNLVVNCLVEVNIGKENSKFGVDDEKLFEFLEEVSLRKNVRVLGLMAIVPYCENPEDTRVYFKKMKYLFETAKTLSYENVEMNILSMGMSNDFKIAIEEGSTLIRIGTLLFGERDYSNK